MTSRIVLVGEDSSARRLLESRLRVNSYNVVLATNSSSQAYEYSSQRSPDAVLEANSQPKLRYR